jgi:hypothetical protein
MALLLAAWQLAGRVGPAPRRLFFEVIFMGCGKNLASASEKYGEAPPCTPIKRAKYF